MNCWVVDAYTWVAFAEIVPQVVPAVSEVREVFSRKMLKT
jgi:hypothetical protein